MTPHSFVLPFACLLASIPVAAAQDASAGRRQYESRCVACHGGDANGGEHGPAITSRIWSFDDAALARFLRAGRPDAGMPAFRLADPEMTQLVRFLRTLERPPTEKKVRGTAQKSNGEMLEGLVMNQTTEDMQILTDDHRLHLLRKSGDRYHEVTSAFDWPLYNGEPAGSRYSKLAQITTANVSRLAPRWIFPMPNAGNLQVTPVVVEGVMYVTAANECWALDAGNGRAIWHYQRKRTQGLTGNAAGGINRGVAANGDRVFMVTDNAHIIALQRTNGELLWETEMADWHQNYNATSAPLVAGNLVITGTAGGDEGVRGFLAAFDQMTGKEVWRFWTIPAPGESGSETWKGKGIAHPGGSTWLTGTYDPQLDTVYWPVGNPGPDFNGDDRLGDNLYADSVVALDAKTGKLKWYFQYTPHDVWDWDAAQTQALVDADWNGQPRKLLLHASRNGFFYVLDRVTGKLLLAKPFVKKLTWASEVDADGRPVLKPNRAPTAEGVTTCPPIEGATNWFSTSYMPETGFYYVQALEKCGVFSKITMEWQAGKGYMGGTTRTVPGDNPFKVLRAIDIHTGAIAWELPEQGHADSWGGVLGTAGGLIFFGDDSGAFAAADARSGKRLWQFQANRLWKASPMTYTFDDHQYVAVASGQSIIAFGLVD
jgi:alcohol dehydrogenase (cytochrome c)